MLVAVTVLVYLQDNVGWGIGLGVPAIFMSISIISFVIGYRMYRHMDPSGSPFTRIIQVCVAAFRKRNLPMVCDPWLLYENEELDGSISIAGKLLHTNQLRFVYIFHYFSPLLCFVSMFLFPFKYESFLGWFQVRCFGSV